MAAEETPVDESEMTIGRIFSSGDTGSIVTVIVLGIILAIVFSLIVWKIIRQRQLLSLINQVNNVQSRKDIREVTMRMKKADGKYADQYQMETLTDRLADLELVLEDKLSFG